MGTQLVMLFRLQLLMKSKLSPQKELIVSTLRDRKWHCGREWLNQIKDDRKRISELNEGYMREKGYEIVGEPCKGTICGKKDCPLFKRKAVKLDTEFRCKERVAIKGAVEQFQEELQKDPRKIQLNRMWNQLQDNLQLSSKPLFKSNEEWFESL